MRTRKIETTPLIPQVTAKVDGWRRRLKAICKEIRAEYDSLSENPPDEPPTTVLFAEDLITAISFMKRAEERLMEYLSTRERKAVWDETQSRRHR